MLPLTGRSLLILLCLLATTEATLSKKDKKGNKKKKDADKVKRSRFSTFVYIRIFIIGGATCNHGDGERTRHQATKVEGDYDQSQALF